MNINQHYSALRDSYLFSRIAQEVQAHQAANPEAAILRMGIGDVTRPLVPSVVEAMERAVREMGAAKTFRGYGEEQGYAFLRQAVCRYYEDKGVMLQEDEIFISDGAKSDLGNILDIFGADNMVLIPDPVYPVYVDTNVMAGRHIIYAEGNAANGFLPMPDFDINADIIYLCSPNNPTGAVYSKAQLAEWVAYAQEKDAVILFDSAYEIFVQDADFPTSIYQIEGAQTCAIEFCSLSKTAGFTGTRCGYTVIPQAFVRGGVPLNKLWLRRQTTKFNGVPYVIQRGAEAVFTTEGLAQAKENIAYYMQNARCIANTLDVLGVRYTGGQNAPYIWMQCPDGMSSWGFFAHLLNEVHGVGTPGAGFGANGEGFFRFTAFGDRESIEEAMRRLKNCIPL